MPRVFQLTGLILLATLAASCATTSAPGPALASTASVDLHRQMGTWHVVGRIDCFGDRGEVASEDVYLRNRNGNVDTVYRYRKSFDARDRFKTLSSTGLVQPETSNNSWRIRFFGIFKADYLIPEVADDYSWALIGQPDRKPAWIFGRGAVMADPLYAELIEKMRGYCDEASRFTRVAQIAEQVGRAGFGD